MQALQGAIACLEGGVSFSDALLDDIIVAWLTKFKRTESVNKKTGLSDAHVVGALICIVLEKHSSTLDSWTAGAHDEDAPSAVFVHDTAIKDMSWRELTDTMSALQISFHKLVFWDEQEGYCFEADVKTIALTLMSRAGFWLSRKWKDDVDVSTAKIDLLDGTFSFDDDGWVNVSTSAVVHFLDAAQAMLSFYRILSGAHVVHASDVADCPAIELFNHHREASLDTFYEISMVSDCLPGSITQYFHKYEYLFHSISQVVYYHWPSYHRKVQLSIETLNSAEAPGFHVLPLLCEIDPDIPVLYEHTGVGNVDTHAGHSLSWGVICGMVLLFDTTMQAFCASDVRLLMRYAKQ